MEAIEPGSSGKLNVTRATTYRRLSSIAEYDDIDYICTNPNEAYTLLPNSPVPVYDEPNIGNIRREPSLLEPPKPNVKIPRGQELATYYEQPSAVVHKPTNPFSPIQVKLSDSFAQMPEFRPMEKVEKEATTCAIYSEEADGYEIIDSGSYETVEPDHESSPSQLRKSESVPQTLDKFSELSLENVSNLNSNEVQLWLLLQMQKVVGRIEEVHMTTKNPNKPEKIDKQESAFNFEQLPTSSGPHPPPYPPPEAIEEIYDEDVGDDEPYYGKQGVSSTLPTRAHTCRVKSTIQEEHTSTGRVKHQDPRQRSNTDVYPGESIQSQSSTKSVTAQKSRANVRAGRRPPLKPKPQPPPGKYRHPIRLPYMHADVYTIIIIHVLSPHFIAVTKRIAIDSSLPASVRQKRETTHKEMIGRVNVYQTFFSFVHGLGLMNIYAFNHSCSKNEKQKYISNSITVSNLTINLVSMRVIIIVIARATDQIY